MITLLAVIALTTQGKDINPYDAIARSASPKVQNPYARLGGSTKAPKGATNPAADALFADIPVKRGARQKYEPLELAYPLMLNGQPIATGTMRDGTLWVPARQTIVPLGYEIESMGGTAFSLNKSAPYGVAPTPVPDQLRGHPINCLAVVEGSAPDGITYQAIRDEAEHDFRLFGVPLADALDPHSDALVSVSFVKNEAHDLYAATIKVAIGVRTMKNTNMRDVIVEEWSRSAVILASASKVDNLVRERVDDLVQEAAKEYAEAQ